MSEFPEEEEEEKEDFTLTIEYTETRQAKLKGTQRLEGRIIDNPDIGEGGSPLRSKVDREKQE